MLDRFIRKSVRGFSPYQVQEYKDVVKLDANENNHLAHVFNEKLSKAIMDLKMNEYPDSDSNELRRIIANKLAYRPENIMISSGADQMISIIINAFIDPGESILTFTPSFSIYSIFTRLMGGKVIEVPLGDNFKFDYDEFIKAVETQEAKIIFLCSPNNPTGGIIPREEIIGVLDRADSIVVLDEAYIEFDKNSSLDLIEKYPNLVVLRTLSKAYGLAGARLGYGIASEELMDILYRVKPVYNVSSISQLAASVVVEEEEYVKKIIAEIKEERDKIIKELKSIDNIKVYESHANFILFKVEDSKKVFDYLVDKGLLVRYFGQEGVLANHLRTAVGTKEDNIRLVQALKELLEG